MDKKFVITVVSIVVIAFVLIIMGFNKKSSESVNIEPTIQTTKEEPQPEGIEYIDDKTHTKRSVKPVVKPVIKQSESVSNIKDSAIEIESALTKENKEESKQVTEVPVKPVVYQDDKTNEVIITTEYKMTSPAKYSFK